MTELLRATCAEGHEWDVWADDEGCVAEPDLRCPSCESEDGEDVFAVGVAPPESLA